MMRPRLICLMLALVSANAWAADGFQAYVGELGGLGKAATQNMQKPQDYTPRYSDNPPMAEQYYGGGVQLPTQYGEQKIAGCKNSKANPDLYLRQECEGVNFIANNHTPKPDVTISANEKLVKGMQTVAGEPAETLDRYRWRYPINADGSVGEVPPEACPVTTIESPAVMVDKTCSQYTGAEMKICEAALKVNVDPNWNYSCLETKYQHSTHLCKKQLVVVCETGGDCTAAGVDIGSFQADTHVKFQKVEGGLYRLTFGTIRDNYWGDGTYDRELSLNLHNTQNMQTFSLIRAAYDDWLIVEVNGKIVYSSAQSDKRFYRADFGRGFWSRSVVLEEGTDRYLGGVERNTSWDKTLDIDIRPYLKEGENTIWTRTLVGGWGESAIVFNVQSYCEPKCHERWDNQCLEFEKKVGR